MAALSEVDLAAILGPDFRKEQEAAQLASGIQDSERVIRAQIVMLDGKKSVSFYFGLLGIVLILASLFSVTGQTLMIQCAVGLAILVVGLGGYAYYAAKLKKLRV